MKKYILGLNAIGFNTSASIICNNELIAAVEEERLIREKRTRKFPNKAIKFCLEKANIKFEEIDAIAISWNPLINLEKFDNNNSENLTYIPSILHSTLNHLMKDIKKINKDFFIQELELENGKIIKIYFVNHHLSHACNYFLSSFNESSILTVDAFGEEQCLGFYSGKKNKIKKIFEQKFPHSLGSFYSTFTEFCGFKPQSEEWKLMGASSYGKSSIYENKIEKLIEFNSKGEFFLKLKYFNHYMFHRPGYVNKNLENYLGINKNKLGKNLTKDYYNIAYAAQKIFEKIYLSLIISLSKKNKSSNLVIAGGCALNCVANGKILKKTNFKKLFVPPVPDDSGAGTGAALFVNSLFNKSYKINFKNNYLGPSYSNNQILEVLKKFKLKFEYKEDICNDATNSIISGKIIAWFQGRLEFGDRALGNRSILADPRNPLIKDKINKFVKYREKFRPFAPAILEEKTKEYFENVQTSYFMENTLMIKKDKIKYLPSVTHVDGSGRLQTVNKNSNALFYKLIGSFYNKTDIPILLNTSFNVQGEPMVCSVQDALKNFYLSGLDVLYIGNYKLKKN
ncbi:carbamoyl transferase [Pelagibacterales bacterium SAG-MED01]|nr:carbamoyl transferase [Pelagibacterales bacterium SAG-MED01]